jgi:quercetin dioxygenase-like cupin family protein
MVIRDFARSAAVLCVAGLATAAPLRTARAGDQPESEAAVRVPGAEQGVRAHRLGDVEWKPGPLAGSRMALLAGDPKTGMHHAFVEFEAGSFIGPHWHSTDEYVTVVSGTMLFGTGETADRKATRLYGPGSFVFVPARVPHYVWAKSDVVLSQTRSGAVDFHWIHPEDDPARKSGAAPAVEAGKK